MNEDFTLEGMMNAFLSYKMESMFTCMPAIVVGVRELDKQKIDVQPVINRLDSDGYSIEYPTILSVPIIFPSSSTSSFTFPISQGDNVLLVFSQKGMDVFKSGDGTPNDPSDARSFDKRDAIAIPCVWPFEKAINQQSKRTLPHNVNDAVISHNLGTATECEVRLKQDGGVSITSPLKVEVIAPIASVTAQLASIQAAISATIATPSLFVSSATVAITGASFTWNGHTVAVV